MSALRLRTQHPNGLIGVGGDGLRLTWTYEGGRGLTQLAYEIEVSQSEEFDLNTARSGAVRNPYQIRVTAPGGPMESREVRFIRVRIETEQGWTEWSAPTRVEAGLIKPDDWTAQAITLPDDPGALRQAPCPLLRREFKVSGEFAKARLYVTALGVHKVSINGESVSDELLNPGWSSYRHRLLAATYDVTDLLHPGTNVISAIIGDGWYRGRLGWDPSEGDRCRYGSEVGLIAQLEIDNGSESSQTIATDQTWLASTGEFLSADLYDGSTVDLGQRQEGWDRPGFDDSSWHPARVVPYDPRTVSCRETPPVRVVARIAPEVITRSGNAVTLDGGQNIAGFIKLTVNGKVGQSVRVRHAEVLESDGTLHTRSLRSAKATDTYVLGSDGASNLEPIFTFHGFRYAEITTQAEIESVEFVAISSDLTPRSTFECSHQPLNRLHENAMWSQRDNFISVPTDCPQRDERLGWTGDAQAFAATASTLFDAEAFWVSWLQDLALDQDVSLGVSTVVPDVVLDGEARFGRAGWADAATIVPWAVYEAYGDTTVLAQQFESMRNWVDSLTARSDDVGLLGTSMQFGDWLDPDAPADRPWEAKADSTFLANAFYARSARLVANAAEVLGAESNLISSYWAVADEVATLTWHRWQQHILETQTGCAIALQFGLVPSEEEQTVGDRLAALVRDAGGRVATGFLGTPHVLPALSRVGHDDEAFLMLLRHEYPSWLYQVDKGATTVWERWDAIRPDGSIHPGRMAPPPGSPDGAEGHMLSFNHYAYGAVIDWVYRNVAGIAPALTAPGYRRVVFAPKPAIGIDWARATIETPLGTAAIAWTIGGDELIADVTIPFGADGLFLAPRTADSVLTIDDAPILGESLLGAGNHRLRVTHPRIAGTHQVEV